MPIEINDCDGGLGNIIECREIVTDQEFVDSFKGHLTQDKTKFAKYRFSFTDLTAITETDLSNESIDIIVQLCIDASKANPDPFVAIAADSDLLYGLSRMYEILGSRIDWETKVFRSRKDAVEWIKEKVRSKIGIDNLTFS